jgi:hypothetical protein
MAENIYLHLPRLTPRKKEQLRRRELRNFLQPRNKMCKGMPNIPYAFIGFLKKELGW